MWIVKDLVDTKDTTMGAWFEADIDVWSMLIASKTCFYFKIRKTFIYNINYLI